MNFDEVRDLLVTQWTYTGGPNEDKAAESSDPTCKSWKTMQNAAYDKFMGEPYRLAIRRAIATWPSS